MKVLVTGGAGYIGSHTCLALLAQGHEVVVFDNFSNSKPEVLRRLEQISGTAIACVEGDVCDHSALHQVFSAHNFDAVIHFAGLKAVGESTANPLKYYEVNVCGSRILTEVMLAHQVHCVVFSSSATVYGTPKSVPINESFALYPANPYGHTKAMVETILRDTAAAHTALSAVLLRYFNPAGAHPSGLIGEDPKGIPNNLMPFIAQVAVGKREHLAVFGDDYPTCDGTGVRDYIHVMDLAEGHVAALEQLSRQPGSHVYNLGTGCGYSVLQMLQAFEKACGKTIPYQVQARRDGDIAEYWADPGKAERELGWRAERDVAQMAADTWRWQSNNPEGF
ncbi:UDP-glucose 4-epimerase GalE [Gilvimarinus agarilyticus]|uniref:UDP-glucose 4-epimerase GalE n=1 Tax=unclassified Gilvimarinus TaxID=2642066 RepID=UPI001C0A148C|nr:MULTISPECIES: UDP-glucose 4-epimerase GalE [unclassified Gilvimarinus]MBU2884469.1 UDP-glucose 4-epimerase GalE [Gilvimarinus agarilyticus]MDO6569605.1 UDP-glucose 4-epimerase GalE [Gilvimarinus sp. 2_MG-2023]MDO6748564.1 UDP-glucose 4-epimerase GalE [Gilvimarinus sp. 1_MG-2023]